MVALGRSSGLCSDLPDLPRACWPGEGRAHITPCTKVPREMDSESTGNERALLNTCENPYQAPLLANANTLIVTPRVSLTLNLTLPLKWGSPVLLKHIKK